MNNVSRHSDSFKLLLFFSDMKHWLNFLFYSTTKNTGEKKNEINYCEINWNTIIMKLGGLYYMSSELTMMGNGRTT